jgi:malate/lactate dehydrogenase
LNRAKGQVQERFGLASSALVRNVVIWGNHSKTQYPDVAVCETQGSDGKWAKIKPSSDDSKYFAGDFISKVQQRGAAIIQAR